MTGRTSGGDVVRAGSLVLAVLTTGLFAGVFVDWSSTIMPGLGQVDDRTFVLAFRRLDEAIYNPVFLGVEYTGALVFTALAGLLHLGAGHRRVLPWVGVALLGYLVVNAVTFGVNVPLNDALAGSGRLSSAADFAAARAELDEARWAAWNTVRALASTVGFVSLLCAMVVRRAPVSAGAGPGVVLPRATPGARR